MTLPPISVLFRGVTGEDCAEPDLQGEKCLQEQRRLGVQLTEKEPDTSFCLAFGVHPKRPQRRPGTRRRSEEIGAAVEPASSGGEAATPPAEPYVIFVIRADGLHIQLTVSGEETVEQVKTALTGSATDRHHRLLWRGTSLPDTCTLASRGICEGAELRLVAAFKAATSHSQAPASPRGLLMVPGSKAPASPRGLLMVPGSKAWMPVHSAKPALPIVCAGEERPVPMMLEFPTVHGYVGLKTHKMKQDTPSSSLVSQSSPILEVFLDPGDDSLRSVLVHADGRKPQSARLLHGELLQKHT